VTEHYTTDTESVTRRCKICERTTQHRVSAGRVGRCMEHVPRRWLTKKQEAAQQKREDEAKNPQLF
jgi:hypothetical protein